MQTLHLRLPENFALKVKDAFQEWVRKEIIDFDPYDEEIIRTNQSLANSYLPQIKTSPSHLMNEAVSK
ncbi:MAG: hypothetical protein WCD18_01125 [Thermosynechococcaceae cyanobacterium]